jgi:diadenosine tetraphosphatase ApaH/serine/threonine PP2A family protein phosphatase
VRLLLFSDIHSNLEALEACLAAAPSCDLVVNLGDVVGYGASPNEVIARSQSLGKHFVRGNHDKAVAGLTDLKEFNPIAGLAALWTRDQLGQENLAWLHALPPGPIQLPELEGVQFVHGSPVDEDEYIVNVEESAKPLQMTPLPLTFFGHTHLQGGFFVDQRGDDAVYPQYESVGKTESMDFPLDPEVRYLINPGSVGQPRDGDWRAAFAVYDSERRIVTFWRVPYDLRSAQERILAANLPPRLATRLAAGR